ncbi:cytochrome-c peroxidase [Thiohalorhabdus sp. Cl-TMA]|uniref:Cytochrome-c peroxidase n=1 Tax=Thiohalorhabdus methylotrophus TaxID=3242694 RepID=A0ABV4TQF3_9GAMM
MRNPDPKPGRRRFLGIAVRGRGAWPVQRWAVPSARSPWCPPARRAPCRCPIPRHASQTALLPFARGTTVAPREITMRHVAKAIAAYERTLVAGNSPFDRWWFEQGYDGRFAATLEKADIGAFKTPTLRNVAATGPYMHDGSMATLMEVVEFYNQGGNDNPYLDRRIRPLGLTEQQKEDLVAFLRALTSPRFREAAAENGF